MKYHSVFRSLVATVSIVSTAICAAQTPQETPPYVEGELVIVFNDKTVASNFLTQTSVSSALTDVLSQYNVLNVDKILSGFQPMAMPFSLQSARGQALSQLNDTLNSIVKLQIGSADVMDLVAELSLNPEIKYVEPNYIYSITKTTNDTYFDSTGSWGQSYQDLWGIHAISAPQAWDQVEGDGIVVAVVDTGVNLNHSDISANAWVNPGEIPNNNIDDDNNGYIDDINGWDFYENNAEADDPNSHGSHVAGAIAATANNNTGVVGVAPNVKIMAIRGLGRTGSGAATNLIAGIYYAVNNGADVINNSWGGVAFSQALNDAINYAHEAGVIVVSAAGNNNSDSSKFYPAGYKNSISVGAVDSNDMKASFSNYGNDIDVVAPGVDILSLNSEANSYLAERYPNSVLANDYLHISGTSMASPYVAAVAALIKQLHPSYNTTQVAYTLRHYSDGVSANNWGVFGDEVYRINALSAISAPEVPIVDVEITSQTAAQSTPYNVFEKDRFVIAGTVSGNGVTSYQLSYADYSGASPGTFTQFASGNQAIVDGELGTFDASAVANGKYLIKLDVTDTLGNANTLYRVVYKENSIKAGWPQAADGTTDPRRFGSHFGVFSPSFADLDNDGVDEVISLDISSLNVWRADGSTFPGFPINFADDVSSNMAIADLDGDGDLEMVFALYLDGTGPTGVNPSSLYAFHHDGSIVDGYPTSYVSEVDSLSAGQYWYVSTGAAPIIEDFDQDGQLDIAHFMTNKMNGVVTSQLFLLNADGSVKPNFPIKRSASLSSPSRILSAADFDNDGDIEILWTRTIPDSSDITNWKQTQYLEIIGPDGSIENSRTFEGSYSSSLIHINSVADIDSDGDYEILFASRGPNNTVDGVVHILDHQLNDLFGWPVHVGHIDDTAGRSLGFGQFDNDNELEVYVNGFDAGLTVLNLDGSSVADFPKNFAPTADTSGNPCLLIGHAFVSAYINKDVNEVFFAANCQTLQSPMSIIGFDRYGDYLPGWPKLGVQVAGSLVTGDLEKDQTVEIAARMLDGAVIIYEEAADQQAELNGTWTTYAGNNQRTARIDREVQPQVCTEFTDTNVNHVTAGRAYAVETGILIWITTTYYAEGSDEDLGTVGTTTVTLMENPANYFAQGECPSNPGSAPTVGSISASVTASSVTVNGVASDIDGDLSQVEIEFDNSGQWIAASGSSSWSYTSSTLASGQHSVKARALDATGLLSAEVGPVDFVINDTVVPVITLIGTSPMSVNVGASFVDPGATAADDLDGNISASIVVTGAVNTNVIGSYVLNYNVADAAGNVATQVSRTVNVVEAGNCFTSTLADHTTAGRAYTQYSLYYATGTATYLGSTYVNANTVASLEETTPGNWDAVGSCN